MGRNENAFIFFILCAFLTQSTLINQPTAYLLAAGSFSILCITLAFSNNFAITAFKLPLGLLVGILGFFAAGIMTYPTPMGIVRFGAFSAITSIIVLVLPNALDSKSVWRDYSILTAILVVCTIPIAFLQEFGIGALTITATQWTRTLPLLEIEYYIFSSIFVNPNLLSLFCALAIVGIFTTQRLSSQSAIIFCINGIGLALSGGRAAMLAAVLGFGIFGAGRVFGHRVVSVMSVGGMVSIVGILAFLFGILPGPESLQQISLSGRRDLWTASYEALRQQPFIGYGTVNLSEVIDPYVTDPRRLGVGPHNSFVKVALSGGAIAGVMYVLFHAWAIIYSSRATGSTNLSHHSFIWSAVVYQLFAGASIFGLSATSVLLAYIIGCSIKPPQIENLESSLDDARHIPRSQPEEN